jgi:hypothetical protein
MSNENWVSSLDIKYDNPYDDRSDDEDFDLELVEEDSD